MKYFIRSLLLALVWTVASVAWGGLKPKLFMPDRLHFSAAGYQLLAERVRPWVVK